MNAELQFSAMSRIVQPVLALLLLFPCLAAAAEPRVFIMGVWPNRLRLFDEQKQEFIGEFGLRHGAVTSYTVTAHTPDYRRLFFVTDRMESVEVVDIARREVVDELKISTPGRRVRIFAVAPDPTGKLLYLHARGVGLETDRFTPEDFQLILYDLEAHEVRETLRFPEGVELGFFDTLVVSPDGLSLFVIGSEIYELSTATHELVNQISWSKARASGFGGVESAVLSEVEAGIFYGAYTTTDPVLEKEMSGILRLDLKAKAFESFELGPALAISVFAVSPDGKLGFGGLDDMVVIDMETKRILKRKEAFERGRQNNTIIVSADGTEIYVTGVGDAMKVYGARTLELLRVIYVGGDLMSPPFPLPRNVVLSQPADP